MPKRAKVQNEDSNSNGGTTPESYFPNEVYQAFMIGYVRRINESTLRVPIGGVRIGSAKHSRLAQINLKTRVITFSRYAIENVPERGRRYLVLHELSHVKEASHNKYFWQLVAEHEPDYKAIGRDLEIAFHKNVVAEQLREAKNKRAKQDPTQLIFAAPKLLLSSLEPRRKAESEGCQMDDDSDEFDEFDLEEPHEPSVLADPGLLYPHDVGVMENIPAYFDCNEDEFGSWHAYEHGIVHGGY